MPEAVKQAAVADRLLISKTDLADVDTSAHLRARLEDLNPGAPLYEIVQGEIDPALLFDSGPFDPAGKSDQRAAVARTPRRMTITTIITITTARATTRTSARSA